MAKLEKQITLRVSDEAYEIIVSTAQRERRSETNVARLLLERGILEFQKDKNLIKEEPSNYEAKSNNA